MNLRFIDWIWNIRGSVALASGQSADDVFGKLDPLFGQTGTTCNRDRDTLTFSKLDQAAQDKMSIFDGGVLRIERSAGQPVLRYRLTSRMLLFCFLAPALFLSFAGLTVLVGNLQKPAAEAKKPDEKKPVRQLHPIDQALGAPAPEAPKKDKTKPDDKKPSPTSSYVFAAMFALLYVAGRLLEDRLIKKRFRERIAPALAT